MATVRLVFILMVSGLVLLLTVQNTSLALPLVFLGGRSLALPVGVWLLGAIALGSLTTLVLNALLGADRPARTSGRRYRYSPQGFYEPSTAETPSAAQAASPDRGDWQDWTDLKAPSQWENWESLSQTARSTGETQPPPSRSRSWFGRSSQSQPDQSQRLEQSLEELSSDWGDLERRRYRTTGVSPVQDSLDEITEGWDDIEPTAPAREFEAPQSPRQVYRDGSIYSYSYGDRSSPGQTDNIYAPPEPDRPGSEHQSSWSPTPAPQPPDDAEGEEAGIVDADYRVLIPPSPPTSSGDRQGDSPDRPL